MNSKLNEQGPARILFCSDEILADAVRITDGYGFGNGLNQINGEFGYGEGAGFVFCITDNGKGYGYGEFFGCGWENGDVANEV